MVATRVGPAERAAEGREARVAGPAAVEEAETVAQAVQAAAAVMVVGLDSEEETAAVVAMGMVDSSAPHHHGDRSRRSGSRIGRSAAGPADSRMRRTCILADARCTVRIDRSS